MLRKTNFPSFIFGAIAIVLAITISGSLSGCSESYKKSSEISKKADNFETPRVFTLINTRNDKIIFRMTGTFSIQESSGDIDIICQSGEDTYEKHFIRLNEWTTYIIEDLTNSTGDLYYQKVEYYPENEETNSNG